MVTEILEWLGLHYPFTAGNRLYWPFLLSALAIGVLYQLRLNLPNSIRSTKIWLHRSARQDYVMFILINVFKLGVLSYLIPEVGQVIWWGVQRWQIWFGYQDKQDANLVVNLLFTCSLFVANDFSRYWLHRWMHKHPWLWRIHSLHHTAQVLTPVTFFRIHPLEGLLFGLRYALVTGLVTSIFFHWFGFGLQAEQWLGSHIFVACANLAGSNLRHSHIPFMYPRWLQQWLISPVQHQWHHTIDGNQHNFGSILAIWDRLFTTLHNTDYKGTFKFGLTPDEPLPSLHKQLIAPFIWPVKPAKYAGRARYE